MKVVITDYEYPHIENEKRIIAEGGFTLEDYHYRNSPAELIRVCKDADAVIVQYAEMTSDIISKLENCKLIIKYGIGVNNIDIDAATEKGIFVCNCPDYGIDEVANHTIALIFSLIRKLPVIQSSLRGGGWGNTSAVPLYRLAGQTLGLVGMGRIPRSVAKKMSGFDVKILAYDPFLSKTAAAELGVELVDFDALCARSDIISLHCPLTPETQHLFGADAFKRIKKTAFLVNTARGPIIDETALIEALNQNEIAGAGLDVFEAEPINPESPLLKLQNVICTPHCAWYSEQAIDSVQTKVAQEVVNTLKTNNPWNALNRKQLGR